MDYVKEQIREEIETSIQLGEFWELWDDELLEQALLTMWYGLETWEMRVIVGRT